MLGQHGLEPLHLRRDLRSFAAQGRDTGAGGFRRRNEQTRPRRLNKACASRAEVRSWEAVFLCARLDELKVRVCGARSDDGLAAVHLVEAGALRLEPELVAIHCGMDSESEMD